jgi:inosose dehydratase
VIVAASPTSWGVDYADAPDNPPWPEVLDGIADAGFRALELGPLGYLPEDAGVLREELAARGLAAAGSFVFEPLHEPRELDRILGVADRVSALVAAAGGAYLLIIDHVSPERGATAGDTARAPRLDRDAFRAFVRAVAAVAERAAAHDLRPVFHPHVATYVEFEDETERLLDAFPSGSLSLCLDTGHALYAGIDPVECLLRLHERVVCLHLKDVDERVRAAALGRGLPFDEAVAAGVFCRLGSGALDLRGLEAALEQVRFDGYATFEQDRDPRARNTAVDDARAGLVALRQVGIADEEASATR